MTRVLINGLNSNSAGGLSVLSNFINCLSKVESIELEYFVLVSTDQFTHKSAYKNVNFIKVPSVYSKSVFNLLSYCFLFRFLERKYKIDVILNFGDLIPLCKAKIVYYFDWAYAVYPNHMIWDKMDFLNYTIRKTKLLNIQKLILKCDVVIAQTKVISKLLKENFNCKDVRVVNNAVSLDFGMPDKKTFNLPDGVKFLYLTRYYPHKNLESLIGLAQLIIDNGDDFKIIVTIQAGQHSHASVFIDNVYKKCLDSVIVFIGEVCRNDLPVLYSEVDALLMPTLLESYSGSYVESMYFGKPIFTSDLDFAHEVCVDSAIYFDPLNSFDIYSKIKNFNNCSEIINEKVRQGTNILNSLPNWEQCFVSINDILKEVSQK